MEIKLTFKDGGAFDFHTKFEQVKEKLQQAVDVARVRGDGSASAGSRAAMSGVDTTNVNLEDLPAYREESDGPLIAPVMGAGSGAAAAARSNAPASTSSTADMQSRASQQQQQGNETFSPPDEPPPGYEEAQMAGLQDEVDRRRS